MKGHSPLCPLTLIPMKTLMTSYFILFKLPFDQPHGEPPLPISPAPIRPPHIQHVYSRRHGHPPSCPTPSPPSQLHRSSPWCARRKS
uniref:Uncharacterized protein n=1 Tax=Utricularia reniformis TaxID=192314 RepID=A0A1Y0B237_9LAMI|nr:hypothetical protein AEK19_MT1250 [Utricularia reniformis]ART31460.1 hypothetical protein AEK19_MT1250 [Utricularia reniformis]